MAEKKTETKAKTKAAPKKASVSTKKTETKAKTAVKKAAAPKASASKKRDEKPEVEAAAVKTAGKPATKPTEIRVTLKKSGIGKPKDQKATITGLGLKRLNQTVVLKDTPPIRGMIRKIAHLVEVQS